MCIIIKRVRTNLCETRKKNWLLRQSLTWLWCVILAHSWKFACYDIMRDCEGHLGYRRPRTPAGITRKRVARRGGARPALLIAPKHANRIRDSAWSPRSCQFRTILPGTHVGSSPERSWSTRESRSNYQVTTNTKNYKCVVTNSWQILWKNKSWPLFRKNRFLHPNTWKFLS